MALLSDTSSRDDLQRKIEELSPSQLVGERLFPLVCQIVARKPGHEESGAKITGMLLQGMEVRSFTCTGISCSNTCMPIRHAMMHAQLNHGLWWR